MSITDPFKTGFPLTTNPFRSRIESQIDAAKNYYAVAFRPGFPLQAAELNEMQEIFYVQQTLTQTMGSSWLTKAIFDTASGGSVEGPGWDGCTPLTPTLITSTGTATSISLTAGAGWYLAKSKNFNGGLGVWVYNATDQTLISNFTTASPPSASTNYGMIVKPITISCTSTVPPGTDEDNTIQDQTNINVINGPCGASRLQLKVVGFGTSSSVGTGETFLPICGAVNTTTNAEVNFVNNLHIIRI
jgi:hypothetical protein